MNYPKLRFVFDRKRVATKKNKGLVQIEVYSDRKRKFISTGVKVYSDQWNERYKVVNTPSAISLNEMLDAKMNDREIFKEQIFGFSPFYGFCGETNT